MPFATMRKICVVNLPTIWHNNLTIRKLPRIRGLLSHEKQLYYLAKATYKESYNDCH